MARSKRKSNASSSLDVSSNGSDNSSPAQANESGAPSDYSIEEKNPKGENAEQLDDCFQSIARAVWEVHKSVQSLNRSSFQASAAACSPAPSAKNPPASCAAFAPQPPGNPSASCAAQSSFGANNRPSSTCPPPLARRPPQTTSSCAAFAPVAFAANEPSAALGVLPSPPFMSVTPAFPMQAFATSPTSCPMFPPLPPAPGCAAFTSPPAACSSSQRFPRPRPSAGRRRRCLPEVARRPSCGLLMSTPPPSAYRAFSPRSSRPRPCPRPRASSAAFLDVGETPPRCPPPRPRPSPALCPSFAEDCDALAPLRACRPRPSSFLRPHPSSSSCGRRPRPSSAMCPPPAVSASSCPPAHACGPVPADPCNAPSFVFPTFPMMPGCTSGRCLSSPDPCAATSGGVCGVPTFLAPACPAPARSSCDVFASQPFLPPARCPSKRPRQASSTFCAIPSSFCAVSAAYEQTFRPLGKRLLRAAERGQSGIIRELLDAGADPNYTFGSHWTPLHKAARKCHSEVVSLLLLRGADIHLRTTSGFTALHIAAYTDYGGQCVQLLIDAGSDVNCKNHSGRTPLHYASESGNVPAVKKLLFAGANRALRNRDGHTPYDVARSDCIRRLLCY